MRVRPWISGALALAAALTSPSCTSTAPGREPLEARYLSTQFSTHTEGDPCDAAWWTAFGSDQLNRLMTDAFAGSLTLEQADARLEQAAAAVRQSRSARRLQVNGQAEIASRRTHTDGASTTTDDTSAGLYAAYELDLWGRLRARTRASRASWEASRFDLQTAAMTLSADLSDTYFNWLAQNGILDTYERQLEASRRQLKAMELRYRAGQATALALLQQRQQVAAAEARLPPVRARIRELEHAIAVLIGRPAGSDLGLVPDALPSLPAQPATGVPAALLEHRPDIRSARWQLESADRDTAAARAARLPTLSLSASATTSADTIDALFDDWAANLLANLMAPLLDGGSRTAEVERAAAVARERVAAYRLAILEAIRETEDALSREAQQTRYVAALDKQLAAATRSEEESIARYRRGLLPYHDALAATVARQSLDIACLQAKTDLLTNRIRLYRALGGDWSAILENQP